MKRAMKRVACLAFLAVALVANAASADPEGSRGASDPTASGAFSVPTGFGPGWVRLPKTYEPYEPAFMFETTPSYRASRALSVGLHVSYTRLFEAELTLWRVAPEARFHYARSEHWDAWVAGQAGFAFAKELTRGCGDCGAPSASEAATHVAPLLGAGTGVEVRPVPFLSFGFDARASLMIFGAKIDSETPAGVTPAFTTALTASVDAPL